MSVGCSGWQYKPLARRLLSGRASAAPVGSALRRSGSTPSRSTTRSIACPSVRRSGRGGSARRRDFTYRGEGQPLSDAHEEAEGSRRTPLDLFFSRRGSSAGPSDRCCISCRRAGRSTSSGSKPFLRALPTRRRHVMRVPRAELVHRTRCSRCWSSIGVALCLHDMHGSASGQLRCRTVRLRPLSRHRARTAAATPTSVSSAGPSWLAVTQLVPGTRCLRVFQQRRRRARAARRGAAAGHDHR